jgi:hypothetical protein
MTSHEGNSYDVSEMAYFTRAANQQAQQPQQYHPSNAAHGGTFLSILHVWMTQLH